MVVIKKRSMETERGDFYLERESLMRRERGREGGRGQERWREAGRRVRRRQTRECEGRKKHTRYITLSFRRKSFD